MFAARSGARGRPDPERNCCSPEADSGSGCRLSGRQWICSWASPDRELSSLSPGSTTVMSAVKSAPIAPTVTTARSGATGVPCPLRAPQLRTQGRPSGVSGIACCSCAHGLEGAFDDVGWRAESSSPNFEVDHITASGSQRHDLPNGGAGHQIGAFGQRKCPGSRFTSWSAISRPPSSEVNSVQGFAAGRELRVPVSVITTSSSTIMKCPSRTNRGSGVKSMPGITRCRRPR